MNKYQRETLVACLAQVFGPVEDRFVDAALPHLRWIELASGETLMREGDPEDGVYFVISGWLRAYIEHDGREMTIGEIGRGETVGEMGVLTGEPRSATVVAIRDSVLAHASHEAFDELMRRHPELPLHMARVIVTRMRRSQVRRVARPAVVCVLAITEGLDPSGFGDRLVGALTRWGTTSLQSSARIDERFGPGSAKAGRGDAERYHRIAMWLDDVEFSNDFVVLAADSRDSAWTRRCLRRADHVLLLARASAAPRLHELEQRHFVGERPITGARQTLVLVHDDARAHPTGTIAWLGRRPVDAHIHLRAESDRDLARLSRIVSGNAIGLVLAGGGARGFAHLGVYRALEEAGVSIDLVGGTSIGGAMAAYISFDLRAQPLIDNARRAFSHNPTGDINVLPFHSLVRGGRLKRTVRRAVLDAVESEADVVDSWRTMFCIASNYSRSREEVITRGSIVRAVCASVSIPVALPPVVWDGDLLFDGGVFNNFPTNVMARLGARRIIGVDLSRDRPRKCDFDEVPGTLTLLRDRLRPRRHRRYKLPGLGSTLMNTTIVNSESRRDQARELTDIYLNPEFGRIGLLEWSAFDRIVEIGYRHGQDVLAGLSDDELAPFRDG